MLATGYYQLLIGQAPTIVGGVAQQKGYLTGAVVPAAVYPLPGKQILQLEEGYRTHEIYAVFISGTVARTINVGDELTQKDADAILINGKRYIFFKAEHWEDAGGYGKFLAMDADSRTLDVTRATMADILGGVTAAGAGEFFVNYFSAMRGGLPASQVGQATLSSDQGVPVRIIRNSAAYRTNADGSLTLMAGSRHRLEPNGMFGEPPATNYCRFSQHFAANLYPSVGWGNQGGISATAQNLTAPDNTQTGTTWTALGGLWQHGLYNLVPGLTTPGIHTLSVFAKQGTVKYVGVGQQGMGSVVLDTSNGSISLASGSVIRSSAELVNGWWRVQATWNVTAQVPILVCVGDTAAHADIMGAGSGNIPAWTAAGTETIAVWGVQFEPNPIATSYFPTDTNYMRNSESFANTHNPWFWQAGCVVTSPDVTPSSVPLPDGTYNAMTMSTTPGTFQYAPTFAYDAPWDAPLSSALGWITGFMVKMKSPDVPWAGVGWSAGVYWVVYNTVTGAWDVSVPAGSTYQAQNLGGGWWRVTVFVNAAWNNPTQFLAYRMGRTAVDARPGWGSSPTLDGTETSWWGGFHLEPAYAGFFQNPSAWAWKPASATAVSTLRARDNVYWDNQIPQPKFVSPGKLRMGSKLWPRGWTWDTGPIFGTIAFFGLGGYTAANNSQIYVSQGYPTVPTKVGVQIYDSSGLGSASLCVWSRVMPPSTLWTGTTPHRLVGVYTRGVGPLKYLEVDGVITSPDEVVGNGDHVTPGVGGNFQFSAGGPYASVGTIGAYPADPYGFQMPMWVTDIEMGAV